MISLQNYYLTTIIHRLNEKFRYKNPHQVPKLKKISVSTGFGLKGQSTTFVKNALTDLRNITGQTPLLTKSKHAIANFKIKKNWTIGALVTLRRSAMYTFFTTLIRDALPRLHDFSGGELKSFDKQGGYSFGISDQLIFPQINTDRIESTCGLNIGLQTSAKTLEETLFLLKELGFPFLSN